MSIDAPLASHWRPLASHWHPVFFDFVFLFFLHVGPEMGSRRGGRGFKRFLEAVGFILAKFEPKPSHGDPIRDPNCGFGTYDTCWNKIE